MVAQVKGVARWACDGNISFFPSENSISQVDVFTRNVWADPFSSTFCTLGGMMSLVAFSKEEATFHLRGEFLLYHLHLWVSIVYASSIA